MMEVESRSIFSEHLQSEGFGFVKLGRKSKKPIEKNWQNTPYTYKEIQSWIAQGGNYGVLGGCGDLVVIDADRSEIDEVVNDKFPPTLTVKTPRNGSHYYYICKKHKGTIRMDVDDVHYGDIISSGAQVVGPGSIHPDTNTEYMVVNDVPIAEIEKETIDKNLKEYMPHESREQDGFSEVVEDYGQPYNTEGKKLVVNEGFWAGLHNADHTQLYEPDERDFYRYDGSTGLYKEISSDVIKQEISKRILNVSRDGGDERLEGKRSNSTLNSITGQLKGISEKRGAFNNNERKIVHMANGVLEFKDDGEADLVSFSPDHYSRNQSPIPFDESAQCPRFLNELLLLGTSSEDAVLIQKYMGLCLLGNNLVQRFLILDGEAGRGKSTLSIIIQKLIGQNNVSELRTRHLSDRFELYRYLKKTLLVGVDVPGDFLNLKGAHVMKGLVGGDWFDAEQKGGTDSFPMCGNYCIVITSNSRLQVRLDGDIGAWRRRLLIVRFEGPKPKKKIPNFADVLIEQEGSGILNFALSGLGMVLEDIRDHGNIQLSASQIGVVDALLAESDSLRNFLKDNVVKSEDKDLTVQEIIESYAEYCPKKGWNPKPITVIHKELEGVMLDLFGTSKANSIMRDGKASRGFRRVRFK
ncbi:MAG: hypothetical protein GY928_08345 [Colwellia sp.]|nr:hypothetical protein [Colwellia sp.]